MSVKGRILYCVLDWGLGHATRSIPIIEDLIQQNYKIEIASCGRAMLLLEQHFEDLKFHTLPDYNIQYSKKAFFLPFKMGIQIPKLLYRIQQEKKIIKQISEKNQFDLIISDNKFGCYSDKTPSVFITHQISIKSPIKWLEPLIFKMNHCFIKNFDEIWIPDHEDKSLSGTLSNGNITPPKYYIGALSRLKKEACQIEYKYCAIISGPEPQRTFLENDLKEALFSVKAKSIMVCGKPESDKYEKIDQLEIFDQMSSTELNKIINRSEIIISRAGYSSIMDYTQLNKNAILIPTPGQTEQEYLATHLNNNGQFICLNKSNIEDIKKATFKKVASSISKTDSFSIIRDRVSRLISSR